MNRLEKAKKIIEENYTNANCGIFSTRNTVGDYMETIYCDDEIQIDICRGMKYFEVFGLEDEEFEDLEKFYNELEEK